MSTPMIVLTVNGKRAEMSVEDAREMHRQLEQLFGMPSSCIPFTQTLPQGPLVPYTLTTTDGRPITWGDS